MAKPGPKVRRETSGQTPVKQRKTTRTIQVSRQASIKAARTVKRMAQANG